MFFGKYRVEWVKIFFGNYGHEWVKKLENMAMNGLRCLLGNIGLNGLRCFLGNIGMNGLKCFLGNIGMHGLSVVFWGGFFFWGGGLALPILRLLSPKAKEPKDFWKPSKPCHVGIHWIALTFRWEPMCQSFRFFLGFWPHFVLGNLATSSIRVKMYWEQQAWMG